MALRKIVTVGDPILTKVCRPVTRFDQKLAILIEDMIEAMHNANGVGLAGPQVGVMRRLCVVDTGEEDVELVNPEVVEVSEETQTGVEGCLSLPGKYGIVTRPEHVVVRAQDRNGDWYEYEGEDIVARCFLHEIDHLDGHMYTEIAERMLTPEELEEMTSAQVSQLKAITGMTDVNERAAYGHFKESRPHIASFCGTSNNVTFLNDLSGNRRWLPFEVDSIDSPFDYPIDYAGVYAQGYALWKSGFHYWFEQEEIDAVNLHNRYFEVPCLERELVQVYYRRPMPGEECMFLTNAQILGHINIGIRQPLSPTRLGLVMKQEGYEAVRSGGRRGYRVVELKGDEIYRNQCAMARNVGD